MKIDLYIQPGAKKSGYAGIHDGRPKIKIAAPPSDGAANNELCRFIATALKVPKSKVKISMGTSSRLKTVEIDADITTDYITNIIAKHSS